MGFTNFPQCYLLLGVTPHRDQVLGETEALLMLGRHKGRAVVIRETKSGHWNLSDEEKRSKVRPLVLQLLFAPEV